MFYNIIEDDEREKYEGYNFITIIINNLQEKTTYYKEIIKTNHRNEVIRVRIELKHSPIPCMYPHSVFEISLNGVVVNTENYKTTIGKNNKTFSQVRNEIRQELTSIIQTGEIDTTNEIEIIETP